MTYVNAMEERQVFDALPSWLINKGFGCRALLWLTGILAFFISPVADNLTTAVLMCSVVLAVGGSMPSISSAAGIALMGQARGKYTFFGHLKWTPVIALGYAASIATHMWVNACYF